MVAYVYLHQSPMVLPSDHCAIVPLPYFSKTVSNTSTMDVDLLCQGVLQEWRPHDWESISYPEQTNKNSKLSFWHTFINELMSRAETNRREMLSVLWVSHCAVTLMNDNDAIITSFSKSIS